MSGSWEGAEKDPVSICRLGPGVKEVVVGGCSQGLDTGCRECLVLSGAAFGLGLKG
jgi:hypothetical protein